MDGHTRAELEAAVLAAGDIAIDLLGLPVVASCWDQPSVLEEMTIGGLAAHLGQMLGSLATWLDAPEPDRAEVTVLPVTEVYGRARLDPDQGLDGDVARTIRTWAADGATQGPADVVARARHDRERLPALLAAAGPDRLVLSAVWPGVATDLDGYLGTRCVELLVHSDDLAASIGVPTPELDPLATAVAIDALVSLCRARAGDVDVLLALARPSRRPLDTLRAL